MEWGWLGISLLALLLLPRPQEATVLNVTGVKVSIGMFSRCSNFCLTQALQGLPSLHPLYSCCDWQLHHVGVMPEFEGCCRTVG